MCDLQLASLVERFGANHEAGREPRGKQDAKNVAEGAHEVIRDKNNDGDDGDGDPDAGLAFEELPAAGDPRPAAAGRHGMSFGNEILLRSHGGSPLVTSPSILLVPWQSPWPPASRPRFSPRRRRKSCFGRSSAPAPRRAAVRRCRRR